MQNIVAIKQTNRGKQQLKVLHTRVKVLHKVLHTKINYQVLYTTFLHT